MATDIFKKRDRKHLNGISRISVQGYKSLSEECSIEIRPLTILAGANSAGKSSIFQPLLLLKQTVESLYDPGALKYDGPNAAFTSSDQFLSKLSGKGRSDSFTITIEINNGSSVRSKYRKYPHQGIVLDEATYKDSANEYTIRPDMPNEEIIPILSKIMGDMPKELLKFIKTLKYRIARSRCFFTIEQASGGEMPFRAPGSHPGEFFEQYIRKIIHVPALRGNPLRTYPTSAVGNEFPGTFENYVASIVNHWQVKKDPKLADLGYALEKLGLTWKVSAKQIDDTQVEIKVGRLPHSAKGGAQDMVSIADVGFGVSQTLPVIVALLVAEEKQMVYIEQPEIHLHPRAQVALASILADAAKRGVRVVVETHSSLFLLAIQTLVAEGVIKDPNLVKLHWFNRDDKGRTVVASADLDSDGAFGNWPEDFGDISAEAEGRFLTAIETRHFGRD